MSLKLLAQQAARLAYNASAKQTVVRHEQDSILLIVLRLWTNLSQL